MDIDPNSWTEEVTTRPNPPGVTSPDGTPLLTPLVRVSCVLGPFLVVAEKELHSPALGPETLRLEGRWSNDEEDRLTGPEGGITTETLRAIPMQEIRARMFRLVRGALRAHGWIPEIPERVDTPGDLARFCAVYVDLVREGHRSPLHRMSELTGVSRNTLSARIRRAREQGILTRPTSTEAGGELTEFGLTLLQSDEEA
ncbi:hypothetical protein [Cellulomonas sp. P5_E12]